MYSAVVFQQVMQRRLEPWRWGAQQSAIGSWQPPIERIIEADPLTTTWEVAEELSVDHSTVVQHLKQTGKAKKLNKWMPHEFTKKKKKILFWSVIFSYSMQQQWTISWSDCDVWWKVNLYNNQQWPVQWLGWEEAPNHFPKPNVHPKKVMVTVWWSAACVIHYSFLNPG